MREIEHYASGVAASIDQQSIATSDISSNVASAAQATQTMDKVLGNLASAATETHASADVMLETSNLVEAAIVGLRSRVEDFLRSVAA